MPRSNPITGQTRLAAVIGHPVGHSLSPRIHNAAFAATGLDWVYVALDVAPGEAVAALDGMRALGIAGLSVTMPHKDAVAAAVDELTPEAAALGAVNCVVNRDGHLIGHNTDGDGFVRGLRADLGFEPVGRHCVVVGAGGAGRAVVLALVRHGAERVVVINRDQRRATVAAGLAGDRGAVGTVADLAAADLVVNATSMGMGADGSLAFPVEGVPEGAIVVDLVYDPPVTPLLLACERRGIRATNGLGMLVHQAAVAFELWTGVPAPIEAMTQAVLDGPV